MQPGIDHPLRSGEVGRDYLAQGGYPAAWVQEVVGCIETHHQCGLDRSLEAQLLSDADALVFLGVIGILRDFGKKPKALWDSDDTTRKRMAKLPGLLCLEKSRQIAAERLQEMEHVLQRFEQESFGCF